MDKSRNLGFAGLPELPKHSHKLLSVPRQGQGRMSLSPGQPQGQGRMSLSPGQPHPRMSVSTERPPHSHLSLSTERSHHRVKSRSKPIPCMVENSYNLQPHKQQRFCPTKLQPIIERLLQRRLNDVTYDSDVVSDLCARLSEEIKVALKGEIYGRYKLVCYVVISENRNQDLRYVSRAVWDANVDNYVTASYSNTALGAVVTAFATYYD